MAVTSAELEKYLKGLDYPASKSDLLDKAHANSAPQDVIDMINNLSDSQFNSPTDLHKAFGHSS
jgi:hypothetical protein